MVHKTIHQAQHHPPGEVPSLLTTWGHVDLLYAHITVLGNCPYIRVWCKRLVMISKSVLFRLLHHHHPWYLRQCHLLFLLFALQANAEFWQFAIILFEWVALCSRPLCRDVLLTRITHTHRMKWEINNLRQISDKAFVLHMRFMESRISSKAGHLSPTHCFC